MRCEEDDLLIGIMTEILVQQTSCVQTFQTISAVVNQNPVRFVDDNGQDKVFVVLVIAFAVLICVWGLKDKWRQ